MVTLLLHQQRAGEALAQFRGHMGALRRPPGPLPPGAAASHAGWLARQYAVMGELLATRVDPGLLPRQARNRILSGGRVPFPWTSYYSCIWGPCCRARRAAVTQRRGYKYLCSGHLKSPVLKGHAG